MGLFDFVGTFFFLSLGITFVLILLLVYHFKQRLTEMEQKSDKMFEIVNTIVKEMGNMRRAISQEALTQQYPYPQHQEQPQQMCMRDSYAHQYKDEEEDEGATDSEDEMSVDDEDKPMVFELGGGDTQEDMNKFFKIQKHDEEEDDEDSDEEEHVKVVSVDLTYHNEDIEDEPYISDLENEPDNEDTSVIVPELHTAIGEEVIHVNKLDETTPVEVEDDHTEESSLHQVSYHKMNLSQLRAYAVSRGLLSDSSKLKKAELIKLLESNVE